MKVNKFLLFLSTAALLFTAAACGTDNGGKETGYNGGWHFDAEYHWRDPDEDGDDWKGPHNFINDVCNLCGYSRKTGTIDPGTVPDPPYDPEDPPVDGGDDVDDTKPSPNEFGQGDTVVDGLAFTMLYGESANVGYSVGVGEKTDAADIEIPASYKGVDVVAIDDYGFSNLTSLRSVTIPDSITAIGYEAFSHCTALKEVTVPDSVTFMDHRVFLGCTALTKVTLSPNITDLNAKMFYRCTALGEIEIPEGVTDIQKEVFSRCTSLKTVVIPKTLKSIGGNAFFLCEQIRKVVGSDIASWMDLSIQGSTANPLNYGADLYMKDGDGEKLITTLEIPEGTTEFRDFLFPGCASLTEVILPESVTSLGRYPFYGCPNLRTIVADGITDLDTYSFAYMNSLVSVSVKGVVTVGVGAFYQCPKLSDVSFGEGLTSIGKTCFAYDGSLTDIHYGGTKAMWDAVRKADGGKSIAEAWNFAMANYTVHCTDGDKTGQGARNG